MRRSRTIAEGFGLASLLVVVAGAGPLMSHVERPVYEVDLADGPLEVRTYPAMIVAQTVTGGRPEASHRGGLRDHRGLHLRRQREPGEGRDDGARAPAASDRRSPKPGGGSWTIRFVMPRSWSLKTLPKADDPRISLVRQPAATCAVIRFSGSLGDASIAEKTHELVAYVATRTLQAEGLPILAFYDPPWTLPFLRRNEIKIAVKAI